MGAEDAKRLQCGGDFLPGKSPSLENALNRELTRDMPTCGMGAVAIRACIPDDGFGTVTRRSGVWKPQQHLSAHIRAYESLRLCGRGACDVCPGP